MYDPDTGIKWLTVARLMDLLSQLPPDTKLVPNRRTGNLMLQDPKVSQPYAVLNFYAEGTFDALPAPSLPPPNAQG